MKLSGTKGLCAFMASCVVLGGVAVFSGPQVDAKDTELAKDERFYMLNVIWFKEDGGQEKYAEYVAAATPFVAKYNGKSEGAYAPTANIIGTFDADLIFFVEWPNFEAFLSLTRDPDYQKISHLRKEAIRDSLLIRCDRVSP